MDKGFDLSDLEAAGPSITRHKYLNGGLGIRYLYLFHSTSGARQLYGLFFPGSVARIFYVDAARNRPQVPNPARWYKDGLERLHRQPADDDFYEYPNSLTFDVTYHGNDAAAVKAIGRELAQHRRGPTILVVHSPLEYAHFVQKSAALTDLPVIMSPAPLEAETSAIMWVAETTARMVKRYLGMASWLQQQIEYAAHMMCLSEYVLFICSRFHANLANLPNTTPRIRRRTLVHLLPMLILREDFNVKTWCYGGR